MVNLSNPTNSDELTEFPLPLRIRELLMRGQSNEAVNQLAQEHDITNERAERLVAEYKADLKERNALLEIQVMHEEMSKDNKKDIDKALIWGARLLIVVVACALLYVLTLGLAYRG